MFFCSYLDIKRVKFIQIYRFMGLNLRSVQNKEVGTPKWKVFNYLTFVNYGDLVPAIIIYFTKNGYISLKPFGQNQDSG